MLKHSHTFSSYSIDDIGKAKDGVKWCAQLM